MNTFPPNERLILQNKKNHSVLWLALLVYVAGLYFFYIRYVPLVKQFQVILLPILGITFALTAIDKQRGSLVFIFFFPLINNLPYFFGINETVPHAPTALVLFLFYFLGWWVHRIIAKSGPVSPELIFKPMILFSILLFFSGLITFLRYSNFFPFRSDYVYELVTNTFGVTAGGAIMSVVISLLSYLVGYGFFLIMMSLVLSRKYLRRMLVVLCVSAFFSLSFGFYQYLRDYRLGNNPQSISLQLINATFKDALSFGAFLAVFIPLLTGILLAFRGILRVFSFLVLLMASFMIFHTGSRIGLIALAISLGVFGFFCLSDSIRRKSFFSIRKPNWSTIVVLVLAIGITIGASVIRSSWIREIEISRSFSTLRLYLSQKDLTATISGRFDTLWKMAVFMIRDYPLGGVGIGGYIIESANYAYQHKTNIGTPESAENYILQVAAELGLIGVLLVLWILYEIFKQIRRSCLRVQTLGSDRFVLFGAISGIIAFLIIVQAHTFIGSFEIKSVFWLLVGIIFYLGRLGNEENKKIPQKLLVRRGEQIAAIILVTVFVSAELWTSTHSLSLLRRTQELGLKQNFGLYQLEKTSDGREFRWTREYGGMALRIEKSVISIPLLASHPDIERNPVKVKIYLVKNLFEQKKVLGEITLNKNFWKTYEFNIPEEIGQEIILLAKVSRTWNPLKTSGVHDSRNLGVAIGTIRFLDRPI